MIFTLIQSYLTILILVATASLIFLILGVNWIVKKPQQTKTKSASMQDMVFATPKVLEVNAASPDLTAIAGDDLMATQLDLARAYIETGKGQSAKSILKQVLAQGSDVERQEAEQLLAGI